MTWLISMYTRRHPRFGWVNIVSDQGGWSVRFNHIADVQDDFDGTPSKHRIFETVEAAQVAVDAFKYDGVIWVFNPADDMNNASYEGEIDGVTFVLSVTDSWRHCGSEHTTWEVVECSNTDFYSWLTDEDDVEGRYGRTLSWGDANNAKGAVVALWAMYQEFCAEHGSYAAFAEVEESA